MWGDDMRVSRRIFYLGEILFGVTILWVTGFIGGGNLWLNTMSPVVFGQNQMVTVTRFAKRFSDSLIGAISPLWIWENERLSLFTEDTCELYPSEYLLAEINEENQGRVSEDITGEGDIAVDAAVNAPIASSAGIVYTAEMLKDYNYFVNQFYVIDSSTYADGLLDAETFMQMDLSINLDGDAPKILIYHTHSQEGFSDSREGEAEDTVVGLGDTLEKNLEERYGISTLHLTDTFDVVDGVTDRSAAYTYAEQRVLEVLEENPSIKVIIDLHRDGVSEDTHLVTNINGKDTAQIMFLNGLCRTSTSGPISYLQNDYLTENLAFSFKLQTKAAEYYPALMRRIYLRSYQYNLHMLPRSLLIECGAQTNTVEEAKNAMPLLADLLYLVLSGN